ncbi:hypothetical protein AB1N83_004167 [Pleurotus pulmonarius]
MSMSLISPLKTNPLGISDVVARGVIMAQKGSLGGRSGVIVRKSIESSVLSRLNIITTIEEGTGSQYLCPVWRARIAKDKPKSPSPTTPAKCAGNHMHWVITGVRLRCC